jgi:hypothetical protein
VPCCPGFMHIAKCLSTLILLARRVGRMAVLPPPWVLLHPSHNGHQPLGEEVGWDRYFDFSHLVAAGVVADPTLRLHHRSATGRPYVANGSAIPPQTPWRTISALQERVVTLELRKGWGGPRNPRPSTDCFRVAGGGVHGEGQSVLGGGGFCTPGDVVQLADAFAPSSEVVRAASAIMQQLGGFRSVAVVHIRRGRTKSFSAGGQYRGIPGPQVMAATSPQGIARLLANAPAGSLLQSINATLLFMTNEDRPAYFDEVRQLLPDRKLVFENEMWQSFLNKDGMRAARHQPWMTDNFLRFQALRVLGYLSAERIGTAACYFYLSSQPLHSCSRQLVSTV